MWTRQDLSAERMLITPTTLLPRSIMRNIVKYDRSLFSKSCADENVPLASQCLRFYYTDKVRRWYAFHVLRCVVSVWLAVGYKGVFVRTDFVSLYKCKNLSFSCLCLHFASTSF